MTERSDPGPGSGPGPGDEAGPARRRYDNTRRSEAADRTRQRIVDAGLEVARESDVRDWGGLTIAAVAARAGVSERTVYRHLGSEQGLREAVLAAIEQRAGIDLASLDLARVADAATRIFGQVARFRPAPTTEVDPTLAAAGQRQRDALEAAVGEAAPGWTDAERRSLAAVLDVLWSPAAYERLVQGWGLSHDDAATTLVWAIRLVGRAADAGAPPLANTSDP